MALPGERPYRSLVDPRIAAEPPEEEIPNYAQLPTGAYKPIGIRPDQYTGSIAGLFNAPKLGTPDQQLADEGITQAPVDPSLPQTAKTILGEEPQLIGPKAPHRQVAENEYKTAPVEQSILGNQPQQTTPQQTTPQQTTDPTRISPEIAVHPKVANSVTKQYGPDMAQSILGTVGALKSVMSNRRGGNQPSSYQNPPYVPPRFNPSRPVGAPILEA
jgi:hypothetical protein